MLEALLSNLLANGLKEATEVILTGCSGMIRYVTDVLIVTTYTSVAVVLLAA